MIAIATNVATSTKPVSLCIEASWSLEVVFAVTHATHVEACRLGYPLVLDAVEPCRHFANQSVMIVALPKQESY
jgi:hypothetical protein